MTKREAKMEALRIASEAVEERVNGGDWDTDEIGNFVYKEDDQDRIEKELKEIAEKLEERYNRLWENQK